MREPIRVTEPKLAKEPLQASQAAKPIWIVVVTVLLWGINGLNVQNVVHELIVTVAISQHRLDALLELEGKCIPTTKAHLIRCSTSSQSVLESELRTVQVRLQSARRSELNRIEEALVVATQPTFLSHECEKIAKELRLAKWKQESWAHTDKVLKADHERELAQQGISSDKPVYRLVGFKSPQPEGPPELEKEMAACSIRIHELEQSLEKAKSKSKGFLSFTGKKKQHPVIDPVGWWRLSVLTLMAIACWYSVSICLKRALTFAIKPIAINAFLKRLQARKTRTESLEGESVGGIPCLGTFVVGMDVVGTESLQTHSASRNSSCETKHVQPKQPYIANTQTYAIGLARLLMALWFAVLVVRFLGDESWRELFVASPLAGLSRLAGGVL